MMADGKSKENDVVSETITVFHDKQHSRSAFSEMQQFREEGLFTDVTIKVNNKMIEAHRNVLAASIPYFKSMLTSNMKEAKETEIVIKDEESGGVAESAMESLIAFAYTGSVEISTSTVQSLMMGASFLRVTSVLDACAKFLKTNMCGDNVLGIYKIAESLDATSLITASDKYIKMNFKSVSESEEFLDISFQQILDLIKSDELNVAEQFVFEAVMKWIKKDDVNRSVHIAELLAEVRLTMLSPEYLYDNVSSQEMIRSNSQCRDMLDEVRDYHSVPSRRHLLKKINLSPRGTAGYIYVLGGCGDGWDDITNSVEIYDPTTDIWTDAEPMSSPRSYAGIAVVQNKLYITGGHVRTIVGTVESFDCKSRKWNNIASMNYARKCHSAAVVEDHVYVCGGYSISENLNSVERYSPADNTWTMMPPMTKYRYGAGVVALEGKLYIMGGEDNSYNYLDTVEEFDTKTKTWSESAPILSTRSIFGAAVLNGKIYVAGGYNGSSTMNSVECYDPQTNKWQYVQSMLECRVGFGLVAVMGKLFAVGGRNNDGISKTVESYCPETDTWQFGASMQTGRADHGVTVLPTV